MTTLPSLQAGAPRWAPALRPLGDERLARLTGGGSDAAFAALYGRYSAPLFGYCRSLLHDEDDARDALQNTMLKALQALRRAMPAGPVRPWLFRIAHNESVSLIRQRARRPGTIPEEAVAGGADAHARAATREDLGRLLVALDGLTAHQRGALVMRELGGLSYDDVARALGTSPVAARQAVLAARRRLAKDVDLGLLVPTMPLPVSLLLAGGGGAAAVGGATAGAGATASGGGLLGGLVSGAFGKAVAGVLATASIGVGSAELATHPPGSHAARRPAAAARADATGDRAAAPTATGSAARGAARPSAPASSGRAATPARPSTAALPPVAVVVADRRDARRPTTANTDAPVRAGRGDRPADARVDGGGRRTDVEDRSRLGPRRDGARREDAGTGDGAPSISGSGAAGAGRGDGAGAAATAPDPVGAATVAERTGTAGGGRFDGAGGTLATAPAATEAPASEPSADQAWGAQDRRASGQGRRGGSGAEPVPG